MGGTVTGANDEEWKALNEKVNSYPTSVNFTAIGSGGDDFVQLMIGAVESVLECAILEDDVKLILSSKGKYVSVRIRPVEVDSSDQVQAIYQAMKKDERMKYFLSTFGWEVTLHPQSPYLFWDAKFDSIVERSV